MTYKDLISQETIKGKKKNAQTAIADVMLLYVCGIVLCRH